MGFDQVLLNLPGGMPTYDPSQPRVSRWNSHLSVVAGDDFTFVDDVRVVGSSKENCRDTHRQFTSRVQYLGLQDAPRKFRPPSQLQAGAWTGTVFRVSPNAITKSVPQDKWDKGRALIKNLSDACTQSGGQPLLNFKDLACNTGFLNHLSMTFEDMVPFLKGFYLNLNSWRPQRDDIDWKIPDCAWADLLLTRLSEGLMSQEESHIGHETGGSTGISPPEKLKAIPRFLGDVTALSSFFESETPPLVWLRSRSITTVLYGFGDASGSGLGSTFACGDGIYYRVGVWGTDVKVESLNWKEFTNVVEALEEEGTEGRLAGSEVSMFTDNSTVESCAVKGSSASPKLLDLVI